MARHTAFLSYAKEVSDDNLSATGVLSHKSIMSHQLAVRRSP